MPLTTATPVQSGEPPRSAPRESFTTSGGARSPSRSGSARSSSAKSSGQSAPARLKTADATSAASTPAYIYPTSLNAALLKAGYYVFLPNPRGSYGQGEAFTAANRRDFGGGDLRDILAGIDAVERVAPIDDKRLGLGGCSYGGFMAMWANTQTDRFKAIVTHASLWALDQFGPTTDAPWYWAREMTPEMQQANSPHLHVDAITSPMLVIHGDKDYRVPIGEALRLWSELAEQAEELTRSTGDL